MKLTMKSAFILVAIEYVVMKGIDFAEKYSRENEDEVENFVKNMIPGVDYDELGWNLIKPLMPEIFRIARILADKIDGNTTHAILAEMANAKLDMSA
jgi:hypothetical protein